MPVVGFVVPCTPVLMSTSILGSSVLMLSLGQLALIRFGVVFGIVVLLYFVYGVHSAARHDANVSQSMADR